MCERESVCVCERECGCVCGCVPDYSGEEEAVGLVVVGGVVVTPQLGSGEREVPELVYEATDPLLLCLQPLFVANVPRLHRTHTDTGRHVYITVEVV